MPERIAHYRILGRRGEGGMGVVYEAFDERLERNVALKLIKTDAMDDTLRKRFWREARMAAAVSHPNVCQVFDVGDHEGTPYLAMELLDGESLAQRLTRGPLSVANTVDVALGMLAALEALHEKHLVHRDVKPANVFLAPHGIKLLDFGLITRAAVAADANTPTIGVDPLTLHGTLLGTPSYMAPEQVRGETATPATDLFAVGAILFEMLTGRRAFGRPSLLETLRAVEVANPPALTGSPALVAVDRALHVALAKNPADRYVSATVMAQELRAALLVDRGSHASIEVREIRRVIVLPFRPLKPDPESDFLATSLPDAITHTLAGLQSLVVRSSLVGAKFTDGVPDVHRLAVEADVDLVLAGTLLRAGNRLQVNAQLFEAPSGTLLKSHMTQVAWGDIFDLQTELVRQVVDVLGLTLTAGERRNLQRDTPASPAAYELYLRANEAASRSDRIPEAVSLYEKCLEQDPDFAPALAHLARCYRYLGKYDEGRDANLTRAESLLQQALTINSELGLAHGIFAQLETDRGQAQAAVERLIERLKHAPNSPELFAGLVYACRFCGLLDASVGAHMQARRFNSHVPTSVIQTYFVMGRYDRCVESYQDGLGYVDALSLLLLGRAREAADLVADRLRGRMAPVGVSFLEGLHAIIEGRRDDCIRMADSMRQRFRLQGEELFYLSRHYVWADERDKGVHALAHVVETGYFNYPTLVRDPWLQRLRGNRGFEEVLRSAADKHEQAQAIFQRVGGAQLLT